MLLSLDLGIICISEYQRQNSNICQAGATTTYLPLEKLKLVRSSFTRAAVWCSKSAMQSETTAPLGKATKRLSFGDKDLED